MALPPVIEIKPRLVRRRKKFGSSYD